MKLDERDLVHLAAVVQAGGVTEGAARIGMSQPGVSRTLAMLERRLRERLFIKGRRPLQTTPLGRALAELGQTMLLASRRASKVVEGFHRGRSGVVRVAGTPFFMDALISGMVADFQNGNPDVRVDQSYGYLTELQAALNSGRIDLAISPIDFWTRVPGWSSRSFCQGERRRLPGDPSAPGEAEGEDERPARPTPGSRRLPATR